MTHLDDLLRYDDDPRSSGPRRRWVRVAMAVTACVIAAYVLHAILGITGVGAPYIFLVSLLLALVALRGVLSGIGTPSLPSTLRDAPQAAPGFDEGGGDGIRDAVNRWEIRLDWTRNDMGRFGAVVQPALVDLVDERLRLHHGISRTTDPVRAQELLGPALWTFVHEPVSRSMTPREVATLVAQMEAL